MEKETLVEHVYHIYIYIYIYIYERENEGMGFLEPHGIDTSEDMYYS